MRAIIFDGFLGNSTQSQRLTQICVAQLERAAFETQQHRVVDYLVEDCRGCFACWLKTPGRCALIDGAPALVQEVMTSDLLVLLTPVRFGSLSHPLKRLLERMTCLVLPFYSPSESKCLPRYPRLPGLLGVGLLPFAQPEWDATFHSHMLGFASSLCTPSMGCVVLQPDASSGDVDSLVALGIRQAMGAS